MNGRGDGGWGLNNEPLAPKALSIAASRGIMSAERLYPPSTDSAPRVKGDCGAVANLRIHTLVFSIVLRDFCSNKLTRDNVVLNEPSVHTMT